MYAFGLHILCGKLLPKDPTLSLLYTILDIAHLCELCPLQKENDLGACIWRISSLNILIKGPLK